MCLRTTIVVALLVCGGTYANDVQGALAGDTYDTLDAIDRTETRLQRWEAAGEQQLVEEYREKLRALRSFIDQGERVEAGDEPELHAVIVGEGTQAPQGLLTGPERFVLGYAKVNVTLTNRPIVLLLSSKRALHWDVELAKGVKIKAVVLLGEENRGGPYASRIAGLPAKTLVSQEAPRSDAYAYVPNRLDDSFFYFQVMAEATTGMELRTLQIHRRYTDPIVLGPESRSWRLEYVRRQANLLLKKALAIDHQRVLDDFSDMRFQAAYLQMDADGSIPHEARVFRAGTTTAEFSLLGPIKGTGKEYPDGFRSPAVVPRERATFGLGYSPIHVLVDGDTEPRTVPVGPQVKEERFTGLCYDDVHHRLLTATTDQDFESRIYEYRFADEQWSELAHDDGSLFALTTDRPNKRILGLRKRIVTPPNHSHVSVNFDGSHTSVRGMRFSLVELRQMPVELVEIDWQGSVRVLGELDLPFPLRPDLHSLTAYHLAVVDDQHVALISPPVRHPRDQYHAYLALLDTRNGSIPYWGPIREHEEARPLPELAAVPQPQGTGELPKLWSQQERTRLAIEQAVESEPDRAARLHEQFAAIVTELDPDSKQLPQAELHWVGVYEGPEVTVRVTETGHPVVLALTSYERVNWKVEAAPGVRIQKVVVVSVTPESTCSVPAGVAVERHGRGQRGGEGFYAHQRNDQNYLQAAAKLQELTDMKIATFQGQYHGGTFEIGTSNPSYRIQRLMVALKQLEKDALDGSLNRRVAELADFQFSAIYVPPAKPGEEIRRPFGNNKRIFADFTLKGPIHGTWTEWSGPEGDVVSDPAEPNVHYVVTRREVVRVRPDGRADAIASDAGLPEIRFRGFLTLDTKRRRLLVSSWGPRSKMSVYDLTQEKWSAWKSTRESDAAITYAAEEDAVYSINQMGGEETLRSVGKYTADGELVRTVTLVSPIPTAMRGPLGNGVQLRYHQGHLFVITSRLPASADPSNRPVEHLQIPWIYIVHFDSGETIYEGELKPHVPPRDLTDEQLQELWEQADLKDLDAVAWQFAAGHDRSTQFLARQFPPLDANYDDATVDRLLAKLDDANFAVRNDASEQLKMLGRKIEPRLERYLETETPSAEVKARLRELLESWNRNLPLTDREKRESLAILALQRIGTPSASDILRELANGPDWALRTVNAKAALGDKAAE